MRLRFDDQRPTLSLVAEGYREARETVGANAKDINPLTSDTRLTALRSDGVVGISASIFLQNIISKTLYCTLSTRLNC